MGLWSKIRPATPYRLDRVIDRRVIEPFDGKAGIHIICDIDKTYLETEFDSLLDIAKVAMQDASDKITVRGATSVLIAARWGAAEAEVTSLLQGAEQSEFLPTLWQAAKPNYLHFVSSSPPQLRRVLEEKLAVDGLDWTSDTFKNQAYNLRKGRMDLLKAHVGYKSGALLDIARRCGEGAKFFLIGDNAESDSYIYIGFKLLVEGKLTADGYRRYLMIAGVDEAMAADLMTRAAQVKRCKVGAILIRSLKGYGVVNARPLTDVLTRFETYVEAGAALLLNEVFPAAALPRMLRQLHNRFHVPASEILGLLDGLSRSGPQWQEVVATQRQRFTLADRGSPQATTKNLTAFPVTTAEGSWSSMSESEILTCAEALHHGTETMRAARKKQSRN